MLPPASFAFIGHALMQVAAVRHPLDGTAAEWLWALPLIPLLGFLVNGALAVVGAAHIGPADPASAGHGVGHEEHQDAATTRATRETRAPTALRRW